MRILQVLVIYRKKLIETGTLLAFRLEHFILEHGWCTAWQLGLCRYCSSFTDFLIDRIVLQIDWGKTKDDKGE